MTLINNMLPLKKLHYIILLLLVFAACETDIDVNLPEYKEKLVVEGYIENGIVPWVVITKSFPYFTTFTSDSLFSKMIVPDAKVTVTSGSGEVQALQFQLDMESPIYYSYKGTIPGKINETYTLKIEWNDKIYTATTSILEPFDLDSIWLHKSRSRDTTGGIRVLLSDNPYKTDYYQFFVKVKNGSLLTDRLWVYTLPLVFDDATFNGLSFIYEVVRATPSTLFASAMSAEERRKYYRSHYVIGDTIIVKRSLMDYASYRFWSTAMSEISFGQNVFMSAPPIATNLKCNTGDAVLGVWCGYASKMDTLYFTE